MKGRQALIEQVERLLLGEPEPEKPFVQEAVLGKRPPKLKYTKDKQLICPIHSIELTKYRRHPGGGYYKPPVTRRTAELVYLDRQPYCSACWEIVEGGSPHSGGVWKFARMKFKPEKRAFLMHRTRPAREQLDDTDICV